MFIQKYMVSPFWKDFTKKRITGTLSIFNREKVGIDIGDRNDATAAARVTTSDTEYRVPAYLNDSPALLKIFISAMDLFNMDAKEAFIFRNNSDIFVRKENGKNMKKSFALLLSALTVLGTLVACSPKEDPINTDKPSGKTVEVSGVSLDNSTLSLAIGESVSLTANVTPANATDKTATWTSSDAGVVSVSNGKVTGVKEGTATITVTAGGKTATCKVTVVKGGFPEGKLPPDNEIWYTTSDNKPFPDGVLRNQGSGILQYDKYSNGMGILHFSAPITSFDILSESQVDCQRVTGLLLPDSVETISPWAFYYGYNIKEFRIPASLKELASSFSQIPSLERLIGNNVSEDGRCYIVDGVLYGFAPSGIESYEIPSGVVSVEEGAFGGTQNLKSVVIPSSVRELSRTAFIQSGIEEVTIPSSVTSIDPHAFIYCTKLKRLLGDSPFISNDRKCLIDPKAYYPMTLFFFAGKDDSSYEIPDGIRCIETYAFAGCTNLKSITFPDSIELIRGTAFEGCTNLETLNGNRVTSDHKGYMTGTGSLQFLLPNIPDDYVVPDEVTAIGESLFEARHTLRSVTMGDNVTSIGNYAFQLCTSLKTVTLSANLTSFGFNPFMYDEALEAVYFRGVIPPAYSDYQYTEAPALKVYVPSQAFKLYTTNNGWKDYWGKMVPYEYTDLPEPDFYMSSDYSKEGEVTLYQKATEGNGIDIVFMGDAYSDREVESGRYFDDLKASVEEYFKIEPYKSFRHLFNFYFVTTVSVTEGYERGGQSLGTVPLLGTAMDCNTAKCYEFALKAVKDEARMDDVLVIVCGNQDLSGEIVRLAGICYMDDPTDWAGLDYGHGPSVATFLKMDESFNKTGPVIRHEAGGHGFAKLGDEYNYSGNITKDDVNRITTREPYGWYKNISLTSDPASIKWSAFLSDERYKDDGVGIFEGAFTYQQGAWRPSDDSMMKNNIEVFNAPSRYAIWYKIHKLAYGKDWKGTYEDFVAYDAINRKTSEAASSARRSYSRANNVELRYQKPAPPVVTGRTWRDRN